MDELKHRLALNMVVGVGRTIFHRLVKAFGSPENVFAVRISDLRQVHGVGDKVATAISGFNVEQATDREMGLAEKEDIRILTLASEEYPELLKSIYDPPPVLYVKGKPLNKISFPLAVVGTRNPSEYGKIVAHRLCLKLALAGFNLVSGLARGIDSMAHRAALEAGADTIAVFGCGLGHTYPPENRKLRNEIVQQGTIVSEFPVLMRPERNNFPARNRVLSGLSLGTVVVEAAEKSGALITADFPLNRGGKFLQFQETSLHSKAKAQMI
jgi:DNA processing protein